MRWDFSDVAPHHNVDQMQQNLFDHINDRIKLFAQRYADLFKTEIEISDRNAMISFRPSTSSKILSAPAVIRAACWIAISRQITRKFPIFRTCPTVNN
ncbi:MAG: hypothetical protein DYG89_30820 [Caldilinea sp. CFX5]|nr:hypothetical protein [Caldilinea sp. CFX5]